MKLLSGILIGALFATGIIYYFSNTSINSSKALAITMNEPDVETGSDNFKVKASGAVTFILTENNEIYFYKGKFDGNLQQTDFTTVGKIIKKFNTEIKPEDLMFIIKSEKGSTFKNAVDILDEMTLNNVPPGHYAETEITEAETTSINILKKIKNG